MVNPSPVVHRANSVRSRIEETRQEHEEGAKKRTRSKGCFYRVIRKGEITRQDESE